MEDCSHRRKRKNWYHERKSKPRITCKNCGKSIKSKNIKKIKRYFKNGKK